ncbi:MAG: sugar transporter [Rhodobacterales bacterium]|nr:MAG: sugar transporter [Rhodobacterales bacterium]
MKVEESGDQVEVVRLTSQTVAAANASSYVPRKLPAAFFSNAGAGGGMRGIGAMPQGATDAQRRPGAMETRLPPAVEAGAYRIGVGDVVLLATKSGASTVAELSGLLAAQNRRQGYTVQDDGAIAIPDVGRVVLGGLTLEEGEAELFQALVENQIDPSFSLEIAEFNSQRVAVGGAVAKPTVVPISLAPLTLEQAILAAGGVGKADRDYTSIRIYRNGTIYQIPLNVYLKTPAVQKTQLIGGDSLFVDTEYEYEKAQAFFKEQIQLGNYRSAQRNAALTELQTEVALRRDALNEARETFQARLALEGVERDYVYLVGEVKTPGRFALPFGHKASLADALLDKAGLSSETGNPAQIYVLRDRDGDGQVTALHLDARNAVNFLLATRLEMRPNDVVFIAEQPITSWNRLIQQFVPSLISTGVAAAK